MTLDEAIKHCKEKSEGCSKCSHEHQLLYEWLSELKELREITIQKDRKTVLNPFHVFTGVYCGFQRKTEKLY